MSIFGNSTFLLKKTVLFQENEIVLFFLMFILLINF